MHLKIWHKLALILIICSLLSLAIGLGLSHHHFKQSFIDYLQQQENKRLDLLSKDLLQAYQKAGSWEFIRANKRLWTYYLRSIGNINRMSPPTHGRPPPHRHFRPKLLSRKISLLDQNKGLLVGTKLRQSDAMLLPITVEGKTIAYLQSKKLNRITERLDVIFEEKQNQAFKINALVAIIISIMIALLVSHYVKKRINILNWMANKLTSGNYQNRIDINPPDELGQLGLDLNQLAKTLEKNRQSQQQWIADISHELRTPVTILKGELEALDDEVRPMNKSAIQSLSADVERLNKLISDLYQLSQADIGSLKYEKTRFDFNGLISEISESFSTRFKKYHLGFKVKNQLPAQFAISADRQRCYQLLGNLLENSCRYTKQGGTVQIHVKTTNNELMIEVEDSAPAVAEHQMSLLFERLYRVESSRSRNNGGAGLGLSIAKQIVQAHQGSINAEHSVLGGLKIICRLPLEHRWKYESE
ncbi:MAG: HAMP domain-containing protein [Gammaproteobacteria bacterium]|nr:HAMP domain-containing protein [Gammaproteobacteria bacterium]